MTIWLLLAIIFVAGSIGGIINVLISDNGYILPKPEITGNTNIIRPGFLGNALTSGVAACISWGLYGPFAATYIMGSPILTEDCFTSGTDCFRAGRRHSGWRSGSPMVDKRGR